MIKIMMKIVKQWILHLFPHEAASLTAAIFAQWWNLRTEKGEAQLDRYCWKRCFSAISDPLISNGKSWRGSLIHPFNIVWKRSSWHCVNVGYGMVHDGPMVWVMLKTPKFWALWAPTDTPTLTQKHVACVSCLLLQFQLEVLHQPSRIKRHECDMKRNKVEQTWLQLQNVPNISRAKRFHGVLLGNSRHGVPWDPNPSRSVTQCHRTAVAIGKKINGVNNSYGYML